LSLRATIADSTSTAPPEQIDLFPAFHGQDWLPDETVYSWASRYHQLSCNTNPRTTALQLFGGQRCGFLLDLPAGIDHFVQATQGHLGSARSIIFSHTILPYYLLFRPQRQVLRALDSLSCGRLGDVKARLGMPANHLGSQLSLKVCRSCMEVNRRTHPIAYWHVSHQLPGVWFCPLHGMSLVYSEQRIAGSGRYHWCLPGSDVPDDPFDDAVARATEDSKRTLLALARVTIRAVESAAEFVFDARRLVATYRTALREQGFFTSTGRLKVSELGSAFYNAMQPLRVAPELNVVAPDADVATFQVSRLLREQRAGGSSLQHFVLITWLFGSWDAFRRTYDG
jgi:TniQ/Tn7-like transposition protein D